MSPMTDEEAAAYRRGLADSKPPHPSGENAVAEVPVERVRPSWKLLAMAAAACLTAGSALALAQSTATEAKKNTDEVATLKIDRAVTATKLEQMSKMLDKIDKKLDELNSKAK